MEELTKDMVIEKIIKNIRPHKEDSKCCAVECNYRQPDGYCNIIGYRELRCNRVNGLLRRKECLTLKPIIKEDENGKI